MSGWTRVCALEEIPTLGARVLRIDGEADIALFRTDEGKVFALRDLCPHKRGPLSQGIVAGEQVTCPLHGWQIGLGDGLAQAPDVGCTPRFATRVEAGQVWLELPARSGG